MIPAPTSNHQQVLGGLYLTVVAYVRRANAGEVLFTPFDVKLGRHDAVEPDLVFLSASRPRVPGDDNSIDYAPDLVVEILSPSSRRNDRVRKMALYARSGVSEYWIADPLARTPIAHVLQGADYVTAAPDTDGWIACPTFAGLRPNPTEVVAIRV